VESKQHTQTAHASAQSDVSHDPTHKGPFESDCGSHVGGSSNDVPVIVELLLKVQSLSSDEPEAILRLVGKLDEIHSLGLVDDKFFVIRILPLLSGAVLSFFGECLRNGMSWEQCKREFLREFFPHFVREMLIRDNIVFNFHQERQPLRDYVSKVFAAASFLQYKAMEEELVGRMVMNLHPTVLTHAAFLDRPRLWKDLINAVGLIEEHSSVLRERKRAQTNFAMSSGCSAPSLEA